MKPIFSAHPILHRLFLAACCLFSFWLLIKAVAGILQPSQACLFAAQDCPDLPWDLVPPLVALGFWVVGLTAWIWDEQFSITVFFFVSSATLAVGLLSGFGSDFSGRLFYILLACLAPVLFQFHIVWAMFPRRRLENRVLVVLYLFALAWMVPFIIHTIAELKDMGWFPFLRMGVRCTVAASLAGVILLISSQVREYAQSITRFRIRLVMSGAVLAFAPLLFFSLLPSLFGAVFIPFEINLAWLLFIPLSYGYSITNQKYLGIERGINRFITYYLTTVLFISGYLFIADVVQLFVPDWAGFWAWAIAGMGMVCLFMLARINQIVRHIANWVLYGSEKDHLDMLTQMTNSLGPVLNRDELRHILVDELSSTIPSTGTALFLKTNAGNLQLQAWTGFAWQQPENFAFRANGTLAAFLQGQGAIVENDKVQKALAHSTLVPEERELLAIRDIGLWIPLISRNELYGLLLIGCRPGGLFFNTGDRQVWLIFAHQAGVAVHNLFLAEDLSVSRHELVRAHQQLLYAREQERHQIACVLHDNAVQQLLGINFQMVALQQKIHRLEFGGATNSETISLELDELRQEILRVITQLREMIGELRPAGLEEFGFVSVLESFVHKLQRQTGQACPQIEMEFEQNSYDLPESVGICLFRVSQEALRNVLNHANARRIHLTVSITKNEVVFTICDDGCGFTVPERLSELTQMNHFGLVSIAERVAWVNGQLDIHSQPGQGTHILVRIPL